MGAAGDPKRGGGPDGADRAGKGTRVDGHDLVGPLACLECEVALGLRGIGSLAGGLVAGVVIFATCGLAGRLLGRLLSLNSSGKASSIFRAARRSVHSSEQYSWMNFASSSITPVLCSKIAFTFCKYSPSLVSNFLMMVMAIRTDWGAAAISC